MIDLTTIGSLIRDVGPLSAFLMVLLWMVWKSGTWLATNILQPLAKAHMTFLETVAATNGKLADTQDVQTALIKEIHKNTAETKDALAGSISAQERTASAYERMERSHERKDRPT